MAKKTAEEVAKEIETLKKMKTSIRQFSHFGDNNWEKVEVQITALEDGLDEDEVYDSFDGNTDHEGCALSAIQWRDGEVPKSVDRMLVLAFIKEERRGRTLHEIAFLMGKQVNSISGRISELLKEGLIVRDGRREFHKHMGSVYKVSQ